MTDPTGRHHDEVPAPEPEMDPDAPLPTDRGLHPLAEVPRPFTREQMEARERAVKDGILRMGSMVAERMLAAIDALERHDAEAATAVIEGDEDINREQQRRLRALVAQTIIRDQPVARDLRFLLALDHVAYDLERMGDHAATVAKQARKLAPLAPLEDYVGLPDMGRAVAQQVRDILTAVVDVDVERARAWSRRRRRGRCPLPPHLRRRRSTSCAPTRPTSTLARASSSPRTTSSASATASRTSRRTSSSWPPARWRT